MARTDNTVPKERGQVGRQRSTNYPGMDLAWAEEIVRRAHSSGTTNRTALAQLIGHRDDTSGPARSKLAALKHFGLVDYEGGKVIITQLGEKLAAPMPDEDLSEALRQSFLSVAAFKQMYDLCAKGVPLAKDALEHVAIRQAGVTAKAASDFVEIFCSSGARAGLTELVDEKSIRVLSEFVAVGQRLERKPDEVGMPETGIGTERAGRVPAWNITLSIDSSMDPENLRGLIRVLKEEF